MTDDAGAATAAAEAVTPREEAGGGAATREAEHGPQAEQTARSSIERAFAEIDRREEGRPAAETAAASLRGVETEPDEGKPVSERTSVAEAPQRFSADAKAAWPTVPEAVKGEVHRSFRELESGLTRYRQIFEPLKPFHQMAEQHETTIADALGRYTALDLQLASKDESAKLAAVAEVLAYAGLSPKDYAARIASAPEDKVPDPSAGELGNLRQELAALKAAMGGVTSTLERSQQAEVAAMVGAFASTHPRLDDNAFMQTVTRLISTRMADDLATAYDMADRLMPAAAIDPRATAASNAAPAAAAHTRKGNYSIRGAPVSGSNPAKRKPASSARESLDRAFAELGL